MNARFSNALSLVFVVALFASAPAAAQTANSNSSANSSAGAGAYNKNDFFSKAIRQAPSIAAPGLAASVQTCLGSTSFGVSGPGIGFGFGTTYRARHCETMMNSVRLQQLGQKSAAIDVLCYRKEIAGALQARGKYVCPVGRHAVKQTRITASGKRQVVRASGAECWKQRGPRLVNVCD